MNNVYEKYELVVGLEVHIQLLTRSKAYSADPNEYGAAPNSNVSVISLGHPGSLPVVNRRMVEYGIRVGLACNMNIHRDLHFARKNYFYADLPKGYQITQDKTPICTGGYITIKDDDGNPKQIGLIRAHLEEDAGRSIHDQDPFDTLIDLNRAGVPLIEVVSAPDIRSPKEAYNYLAEVRKLVRYLDICDGNLEEGSMRCDANVSVRLKGSQEFGTRAEVKNMNSLRNVQKAIEYEMKRQIDLIEAGERVVQETRSFDAATGSTFSMRSKEQAHDYRYFPEPDLQPLFISEADIDNVKANMPALPSELFKKYTGELGLSEYDASVLTENKEIALYFEELIGYTSHYKAAANWVTGDVKSYLNNKALDIESFSIRPNRLAGLIELIQNGKLSYSIAAQKVFPVMAQFDERPALEVAMELNALIEVDGGDMLRQLAEAILNDWPDKVAEYRNGKKGLLGLFMGELMKRSQGKANPKAANELIRQLLENQS